MIRVALLTIAVVLASCRQPDTLASAPDPQQIDYAPELNIDFDAMIRTPSGVYVQDVRVGVGEEVEEGDTIEVLYSGWLPNGTLLEARNDSASAALFVLGTGNLVAGWNEGIAGMRVGGFRKLIVPPELAFGRHGRKPVPPNSTLVFDIELLRAGH